MSNGSTKGQRPPLLSRSTSWTLERITALSAPEVRQLRDNAERLQEPEIAALCEQALSAQRRAKHGSRSAPPPRHRTERRLVSRSSAFGMRGVNLANRFWSRSGLTAKGEVVFALWADDVQHARHNGSSCLLWAPNVGGARPWSDSPGGLERLEHCRRALGNGAATGLLVYGTRSEGVLPEQKAARVDGADPNEALALRVEKRGQEYWAVWGEAPEVRE
jgi:hypothetical protein